MVERALLKLHYFEPNEVTGEVNEPQLEVSWYENHPGNIIESSVILHIMNLSDDQKTQTLSHFIAIDGSVIFIKWYGDLNGGICTVLHLFNEAANITPLPVWGSVVWHFYKFHSLYWEFLLNEHLNLELEEVESLSDIMINSDWLQATLEGGQIEFEVRDRTEFINDLNHFLEIFPWSVFLLDFAEISDDKMKILFYKGDIKEEIPYDELYFNLVGENRDQFWNLMFRVLSKLKFVPEQERFTVIRTSIFLILQIIKTDNNPVESLVIINKYIMKLFEIDVEYTIKYVTNALTSIGIQEPTYDSCRKLLEVSTAISETKYTDLVKLAEGTALQIAFSLSDPEQKAHIFLETTRRSMTWGSDHLVGYIQSITGILSETSENREILSKVIDLAENMLKQSWDGTLCLVESNLIAGQLLKAVELRIEAVNRLTDKFMRAEDTFQAINWTLEIDKIDEKQLTNIILSVIGEAISNLPIGEIFQSTLDSFVVKLIDHSKFRILMSFVNWINANMMQIGKVDRMPLLNILEQRVRDSPKLNQILIQVQLIKFNLCLESGNPELIELADDLLRDIYNLVNPSKSNAKELTTHITSWIILSATKYNLIEYIEDAKKRFSLLIEDEEYTRKQLMNMYSKAVSYRLKLRKSELKKNGIGILLFNDLIELSNPEIDIDFLLEVLPIGRELSFKKQSYEDYARFTIHEVQLLRTNSDSWMGVAFESTEKLIDKGAIDSVNKIFNYLFSVEITPNEEYQILTKQLQFVEVEPDLISATQIFEKRQRVIQIFETDSISGDVKELVNQYRNGVSELMAKGDVDHLNDLLLKAIVFCNSHNLMAVEEFSTILQDSFANILTLYSQSKSNPMFKSLMTTFRQISSTFENTDLNISVKFAQQLIEINLSLLNKSAASPFLRRAEIVTREIAVVIKNGKEHNLPINIHEKQLLLNTVNELLHYLWTRNRSFGTIDAAFLSAFFYFHIGEPQELFTYLDKTLSFLKREVVHAPALNSTAMIGLLVISEISLIIEAEITKELRLPLQERAVKLLDVILSITIKDEIREQLLELKSKFVNSPLSALQEFSFSLDNYLQLMDKSMLY